jgi:hypothetical protein
VDDGVEIVEPVNLVGDRLRLRDDRKVAYDDILGASNLLSGFVRTCGVAGVQNDLVSLFDQKLGPRPPVDPVTKTCATPVSFCP